eukprot:gnl/TRDRNA2_/TRDRNA2_177267_c16_seq3.p1 gnl/TRDRNA2_/TRDRNA2_177267_c16~~gnl/TRDRNA2_/TRDRNA2_177267_c16_seq3.p1  ORF type:complete len:184 (+),score=27.12 gnl/TRDRNA2_/TRDRNA2_177267_c16_seq3:84-635(+)
MCSIIRILLLAFVVRTHAKDVELFNRAKKAWFLHHADLDGTLLLKTQQQTQSNATYIERNRTCSAHDKGEIVHGDFSGAMAECFVFSLGIIDGLNENRFNRCFSSKLNVSMGCSTCFAETAMYDEQNCKLACMRGFHSEDCVKCTAGFDTSACAGFHTPGVRSKEEHIMSKGHEQVHGTASQA